MARAEAFANDDHHLILGRYRALRPLGTGGSGTVWLVRDVIGERDVALKVVPREGKAGERAKREALAVARLRSPAIARAYAVHRDERHVYVAYEYIAGKTVRQAIRAGELDDSAVVEAGAQILDALAHAHRRGIIHRDVKPANVLVADNDGVSIHLLDFGLALVDEADTLTAAGDVPGTLAYISPERLKGEPATGAADVWAVGVILWESLAGYPPFWSASPVETARLIAAGAPPLGKVRPDLPRELTVAVDRALARDPRRRPSPERLASDLRTSRENAARRRERRPALARTSLLRRAVPALCSGAFAALATTLVPFFPTALIAGISVIAALAGFLAPRLALAIAMLAPALPLADYSTALALVWLALAGAWFLLSWGDAKSGLLCVCGPLLATIGLLPLAPLVCAQAAGPVRRFAQGSAAVLLAAIVAGLDGARLPYTGAAPPLGLGIEGSDHFGAVAGALWGALTDEPAIALAALVVGTASACLPLAARGRSLWSAAAFGAIYTAAAALVPTLAGLGDVAVLPVLLSTWLIAGALAIRSVRTVRASLPHPVQ
jgi:eukaryotic-like serine/threonine-protein kinase